MVWALAPARSWQPLFRQTLRDIAPLRNHMNNGQCTKPQSVACIFTWRCWWRKLLFVQRSIAHNNCNLLPRALKYLICTINWGGVFPVCSLSHHRAIEKPHKVQPLEPVGSWCPARSSSNDSRADELTQSGRGDITLLATPPTPLKTNQPAKVHDLWYQIWPRRVFGFVSFLSEIWAKVPFPY